MQDTSDPTGQMGVQSSSNVVQETGIHLCGRRIILEVPAIPPSLQKGGREEKFSAALGAIGYSVGMQNIFQFQTFPKRF